MLRRAGEKPGRTAVPGAAGARPRNGSAADWEVQAARGPVNGAADGGGAAADSRGPAKALAKTCGWAGAHGRLLG
jgi:hypothetical protein